jgi:hypothetical protein
LFFFPLPMSLFHHKKILKISTLYLPYRRIHSKKHVSPIICPPISVPRGQTEAKHRGQSEVLLGKWYGTCFEAIENIVGTWWEHIANNNFFKRQHVYCLLGAWCNPSMAEQNTYSQPSSSPNSRGMNCGGIVKWDFGVNKGCVTLWPCHLH